MTEPATTFTASTVVFGVGIASMLPFVNADAIIGSCFGAAVITVFAQKTKWYLKIVTLLLSIVGGYAFGRDVAEILNIKSIALSSCFTAVVCIPAILKVSTWFDSFNLSSFIKSRFGGGK